MSKSSILDKTVKSYIISCIAWDGYNPQNTTYRDKVQFLYDTFISEYSWRVDQVGQVNALRDWLQGLPSSLSIVFYDHDILTLAKSWGSLPEDATEDQEWEILDNYWDFIANKINQLFTKYILVY